MAMKDKLSHAARTLTSMAIYTYSCYLELS